MASLGELLGEYLFGMPQDAEVVEGTRGNVLPGAKYRLPDGTERWGVAAPQGLADALLGLGAAGGRVQDPNAPQGYVAQETLRRGGEGLAGSATLGSFATRAPAGALRAGAARSAGELDPSQAARMARAREMGFDTDRVLYHQTAKENEQALMREGFDLSKARARLSDEQVPDAVFMKPDTRDINVGAHGDAAVQIPLYARAQNTAYPGDRHGLEALISYHNPKYREQVDRLRRFDRIMARRSDNLEKNVWFNDKSDEAYGAGLDRFDNFTKKWIAENERMATLARKEMTKTLRELGYDSVEFKDKGSGGRETTSFVVLDPNKIRSVNAMFDPAKSDSANLLAANPLAGAVPLTMPTPGPQGPTISDMGGRPIPPEEEAQRQALIRYLEGGM